MKLALSCSALEMIETQLIQQPTVDPLNRNLAHLGGPAPV